ncbi:MAG: MFS transporter [Hyphomicrobiaceae bacterium]
MDRDSGRVMAQGWTHDVAVRAVIALGITQIVSWGTTLYSLGTLGKPIMADTRWGAATVYGGLSLGLLVAAALSKWIGRLIDERGGRVVMSLGSVVAALGLGLVAWSPSPAMYLAGWVVLGVGMRLTLYDAAFAALVQVTPSRGRRAISYLTLFGGLASSVFWPVADWLEPSYGWRGTLLIYAAINLVVCLPLHWFGLAQRETLDAAAQAEADAAQPAAYAAKPLEGRERRMGMILFSVVMAASAFVMGAMAAHLPSVIAGAGVTAVVATTLASLKGVAQTLSRLGDLVFGRNLHPITLGRITIGVLPLAFALWFFGGQGLAVALVFALLFGISNGLTTIVRGAVPLALFGPKGYGEVLGILATPYLVLNATAPMVFAVIMDRYGLSVATGVLLGASIAAVTAIEIMAAWYRGAQRAQAAAQG